MVRTNLTGVSMAGFNPLKKIFLITQGEGQSIVTKIAQIWICTQRQIHFVGDLRLFGRRGTMLKN